MIMIFTCLLNSHPLKGGVDSVSRKEAEDEVVLINSPVGVFDACS
jgi:hypothetical protein